MNTPHRLAAIVVAGLFSCACAVTASEPDQPTMDTAEPHHIVSIYRVAPGKHAEFLEWMAVREDISRELGLPTAQWYAHSEGSTWDYLAISPPLSDEQSKKMDQALAAASLKTGFKAGLELRKVIASHTDTYAWGPVSVGELAAAAGGCCQCASSCQDVTRAGQCRGLCGPGGGTYMPGLSCVRNTCQ